MYLWAAQIQSRRGMAQEAAAHLTKTRDIVSSVGGTPTWAWAGAAGVPLGTYFMSGRVDSIEQYMEVNQAVSQNADYHNQAKAGAEAFEGPTEMMLGQVVGMAGELGEEPSPLVMATTVAMVAGKQMDAVAWGVDLLDHLHALTGVGGMLAVAAVGSFGEMSFIAGFDSGAEIDRFNTAMLGDGGYHERVGRVGDLVISGSGRRFVMAKLP
ncbi:MAG: hypothetical protein OER95_09300 [Acidimicrobiia bacterium]|nr:hypothetical protein [Acidimicrobiia bacterium]